MVTGTANYFEITVLSCAVSALLPDTVPISDDTASQQSIEKSV